MWKESTQLLISVLITMAALIAITARNMVPTMVFDSITLGLIVIAIIPWLAPLIQSIEWGGAKIEFRARIEENERAITDLTLLSMGPQAYDNLKKLATGNFGPYEKEHFMGLETELYHLRNLGYVKLNEGKARSIYDIPKSDPQLSDYIKVTEQGEQYIDLREKLARKG